MQKELSVFSPSDAHTARRLARPINHRLHSFSLHYTGSCFTVRPGWCFNATAQIVTDKIKILMMACMLACTFKLSKAWLWSWLCQCFKSPLCVLVLEKELFFGWTNWHAAHTWSAFADWYIFSVSLSRFIVLGRANSPSKCQMGLCHCVGVLTDISDHLPEG